MKKTIFALFALALVIASLAGGAAFILRQKHLKDMSLVAQQAEDKLQSKSYDQAISMLRKVEAEGGTDRSTYLLGKAFYEQGKYEESNRYFSTLLEKYPKSALVADTRLMLARYDLNVLKDTDAALKECLDILQYWPKTPAADHALVMLSKVSLDKGDEVQARKNLELVLKKKDSPGKSDAEFLIGDLNMKRLKSPDAGPGDEKYTISRGDTIDGMSRKYKVPADLLVGINNLNPQALQIGREIRIPKLDISLEIDKAERTLTIINKGDFLKKYHVGLNADDGSLPAKEISVTKKLNKGMDYTKPDGGTIKAGTSDNPYGTRYIEMSGRTAIHGTNNDDKVGQLVEIGSVVMSNQDVEEVYALVQLKTKVTVKNSVNPQGSSVQK